MQITLLFLLPFTDTQQVLILVLVLSNLGKIADTGNDIFILPC